MAKAVIFCCALILLGFASGQTTDEIDLNKLFDEVFTKSPGETPIPNGANVVTPTPNQGGAFVTSAPAPPVKICDGGECVQMYQCYDNGTFNTGGEGLLDIRIDVDERSLPCGDYLQVCCSAEQVQPKPIIPPIQIKSGCGFRNTEGIAFRISGDKENEAQFGEFPWMVAVLKKEQAADQTLNVFQCGGSLIHPNVVLTAAHCVAGKPPNVLKIRAGEWDTQTPNEILPHQDREVKEVLIHEQFYKGALHNDVALLILSTPVDLADNVQPVCLPPQDATFDYIRCYASGWGKDVFGKEGVYQVILKNIDLPVVPRDNCQTALRSTRLGKYFELHKSFICAGGEKDKDTCRGDGGSPLVCPINGDETRYYQAGIVAWGIGCGENQLPGVYVNVAFFRNWIDQKLSAFGLDQKFYTP